MLTSKKLINMKTQIDSKYMMCVHYVKLKSRHLYKSYVIGHTYTQIGMKV
jgi:hypothetical protein